LAVAGLREAGNQHRYNNTPHFNLLCSQLRRGCWPSVTDTEASVCGLKRPLHPPQTQEFRSQSGVSQKGKTGSAGLAASLQSTWAMAS
jgi:hypothetical protein